MKKQLLFTLKKYKKNWILNLIKFVIASIIALITYQFREALKNSTPESLKFKTLIIFVLLFAYLILDFVSKFLETKQDNEKFYTGLLEDILREFDSEFHRTISNGVVFRITLFRELDEAGQKYLYVYKRLNSNGTGSSTKWPLSDTDRNIKNGIAGLAWRSPGEIKMAGERRTIEVIMNGTEADKRGFADLMNMTLEDLHSRYNTAITRGANYLFPLKICSYSERLNNGQKFVIVLDTDQRNCNISGEAKEIIKEYSKYIKHILNNYQG